MMAVSIQGGKGSFHHVAALDLLGARDQIGSLCYCMSFVELALTLSSRRSDLAVVAVENTIVGPLLSNYRMIDEENFKILEETQIRISHYLLALKGQAISDIREVRSHPVALQQCQHFFKKYPAIKLIEDVDTAEVAKNISESSLCGVAAIASKEVAQMYQLGILAENIQSDADNRTRFLLIGRSDCPEGLWKKEETLDKASIKVTTQHKNGALVEVLQVFKEEGISLVTLHSVPIPQNPWRYSFFIDLTYEDLTQYEQALKRLGEKSIEVKGLGKYKQHHIL